jgi:chromodomain-helicase-DNA-binding protein 4
VILSSRKGLRDRDSLSSDSDVMTETEHELRAKGPFIHCSTCTSSYHFGCISKEDEREMTKVFGLTNEEKRDLDGDFHGKLKRMRWDCARCAKDDGERCGGCRKVGQGGTGDQAENSLLFRCSKCHVPYHYSCLPDRSQDQDFAHKVYSYQVDMGWKCDDCDRYSKKIQHIIAWAPDEGALWKDDDVPDYRTRDEKARYLVKFEKESYRETMWLVSCLRCQLN